MKNYVLKVKIAGNDNCSECNQMNQTTGMRYCSKDIKRKYNCSKSINLNSMHGEESEENKKRR